MIRAATDSTPSALARPVEDLEGVGPARAKALKALGLHTLGDLLEYFPRDYQFESPELTIRQLVAEQVQTVRGTVVACDYVARGRPRFEATLDDGTGKLALVFFHSAYLRRQIHPGIQIRVQGRVKFFRNLPQMANAKWHLVDEATERISETKFRPIYPASMRLPSDAIERVIAENLDAALEHVHEWFDAPLLAKRNLFPRRDASRATPRPTAEGDAIRARRRIIYDELM